MGFFVLIMAGHDDVAWPWKVITHREKFFSAIECEDIIDALVDVN